MLDPNSYGFCQEVYVLEKTIEVVVTIGEEPQSIRIEAIVNPRNGKRQTRAYLSESFTIQPTYPQTGGKFDRASEEHQIWVDYDLPWTDRDTADDAITQALGFLKEKCDAEA